jgi:DNA-binding IclR family transcriptional regulator
VKVLSIEIRARRPLGVGVSGLGLLAALPPDAAQRMVARNAARLGAIGIEPGVLLERAATVRRQGHAYTPVGVVPGTRAVAVPVCAAAGATVAGLAVATITGRLPATRLPEAIRAMTEAARGIGERLGPVQR